MSDDPHCSLDHRPSYGFERFDDWMQQLQLLRTAATVAAVVKTLEEDGRNIDVKRVTRDHRLNAQAVKFVQWLARFGDLGHPVHAFASVHIAEITASAGGSGAAITTYVCATRRGGQLDFWWADAHDGFGALGIRDQPLTLIEAITMVANVISAQAASDLVDGGDRTGYTLRDGSTVSVRSGFYPMLDGWVRRQARRRRRQDEMRPHGGQRR